MCEAHVRQSDVVGFEVFGAPDAGHAGDQARGEHLGDGVEVAHVGVVEAAGGLDAVLGLDQLLLQVHEVAVGLELGVALGDGEQRFQGADERVLVAGLGLFILGFGGIRRWYLLVGTAVGLGLFVYIFFIRLADIFFPTVWLPWGGGGANPSPQGRLCAAQGAKLSVVLAL